MSNSMETVSAAANAIVSAESRVQQVTVPRRRWGTCFSMYWCFGSQKHEKRIGHAVLVPDPALPRSDAPASENPNHSPAFTLPFVVPPSSPASFLQSESQSAVQSPAGFRSLSALSANAYSPTGPSSIFAIGPYANETQLVSPPVFSTFTTEPSTAPLTPPPESVQLTTPSSPEVPFAKLLTSSFNTSKSEACEFQSYHLYPGSPIGHLISPSSVCSGTSSPFPDLEFHASGGVAVSVFPMSEPPKILTSDVLAERKLVPLASRENGSLIDGQITAVASTLDSGTRPPNDEPVMNHRVSFELTAEDVTRCMEKKPVFSMDASSESPRDAPTALPERTPFLDEAESNNRHFADEIYHDMSEELRPSAALSAAKEFKFNNADGADAEPAVASDWWVHGKVVVAEAGPQKKWAFFPMIQPGVS